MATICLTLQNYAFNLLSIFLFRITFKINNRYFPKSEADRSPPPTA
jgi:hypothetical protein